MIEKITMFEIGCFFLLALLSMSNLVNRIHTLNVCFLFFSQPFAIQDSIPSLNMPNKLDHFNAYGYNLNLITYLLLDGLGLRLRIRIRHIQKVRL